MDLLRCNSFEDIVELFNEKHEYFDYTMISNSIKFRNWFYSRKYKHLDPDTLIFDLEKPLLFIDWDDTVFPTTRLFYDGKYNIDTDTQAYFSDEDLNHEYPELDSVSHLEALELRTELSEIYDEFKPKTSLTYSMYINVLNAFLMLCKTKFNLIIVTNMGVDQINTHMKIVCPSIDIKDIPIFYTRRTKYNFDKNLLFSTIIKNYVKQMGDHLILPKCKVLTFGNSYGDHLNFKTLIELKSNIDYIAHYSIDDTAIVEGKISAIKIPDIELGIAAGKIPCNYYDYSISNIFNKRAHELLEECDEKLKTAEPNLIHKLEFEKKFRTHIIRLHDTDTKPNELIFITTIDCILHILRIYKLLSI